MVTSIARQGTNSTSSDGIGKMLFVLLGICLIIVGLTIFQDFLASKRSGYAFYFEESLLFKTVWFLFIPILAVLHKKMKEVTLDNFSKTALFIVSPIVLHLFILPFVAMVFSLLFFQGRYDLYKFFSFALANDLYILVLVYTGFVLVQTYLSRHSRERGIAELKPILDTIVIKNGKDHKIVHVEGIIMITSNTPYISIHLKDKKYLHSDTLKSLCEQLDNEAFVQVHRSTVVNIAKVGLFRSRLNGDYDLQMVSGEWVRLSRTYAANFKTHYNPGHRVSP